MRYLESKFSVGSPGTKAYADSWERIFTPAKQRATDASEVVTLEVTAGCEAPGGSRQGAGGEGEVTRSPYDAIRDLIKAGRIKLHPRRSDAPSANPKKQTEEF